jgi:DNA-binding LytR/AlgR family response regulator
MKMQCIIVDDEPLARRGIENFIKEIPFLELSGSCGNPLQAIDLLSKKQVDLLFLDIQMPKMTGIDFLKNVPQPPITIITSAYSSYALESYELAVIDYLLKPIPFERFVKAVHKAKDYFELQQATKTSEIQTSDFCFIKCDKTFEKIYFNDVLYVEAMQNYVVIYTTNKKFISYLTLKVVEENLPQPQFIKISKSFIVNQRKIESIDANEILLGNVRLQISRTYKDYALKAIFSNALLKR